MALLNERLSEATRFCCHIKVRSGRRHPFQLSKASPLAHLLSRTSLFSPPLLLPPPPLLPPALPPPPLPPLPLLPLLLPPPSPPPSPPPHHSRSAVPGVFG